MKRLIVIPLTCILILLTGMSGVLGGTMGSTQFYQWLDDSGIPEYSVSGTYRADYSTYIRYNLVVYGRPDDVTGNEIRQGEYRYHGFTYMETKYTNLDFPNDETGNLPPEQWDYVDVNGARESWDSLEQTVQKPYMLHTPLRGHGAGGLTAADIGLSKAKVQSAASWVSSGSIYTYKANGFYATFTVPDMGRGVLTASMHPDESTLWVDENDTSIDVGVSLTASVNKPESEVAFIKVIFTCDDWRKVRYFHDTNNISIHQDASPDLPDEIPGQLVIHAHITSESIFGDRLSRDLDCTINLRDNPVNGTPEPAPVDTPSPTPHVSPAPSSGPTSEPTLKPTPRPTPVHTPKPTKVPWPTEPPDEDEAPSIDASLTGSWNHWENPHRFLALEKIHLSVTVAGYMKKAVVRMSPQLEAMTYTNTLGHTYNYEDDFFGYKVRFPEDSTLKPLGWAWKKTRFSWEYSLPMCDETVGWNGDAKRKPYIMTITVYDYFGHYYDYVIDDIDITGNIYELLYPQPAD